MIYLSLTTKEAERLESLLGYLTILKNPRTPEEQKRKVLLEIEKLANDEDLISVHSEIEKVLDTKRQSRILQSRNQWSPYGN